MRKHILSVLVQNQPGVLAHIAGMFAARGFNIDSLVVGRTEDPAFSRMVIASTGDELTLEQIRKQLGKIVTVVKVRDLSEQAIVERDLLLLKVHCPPERRGDLRQITEVFRGSIVDVGPQSVVIQLTGPALRDQAALADGRDRDAAGHPARGHAGGRSASRPHAEGQGRHPDRRPRRPAPKLSPAL